ncbi:MAG: ATP-dependent Clp protease ATP-binding subunit [Hyphomicrobiaceae bacterium]
MSQFEAGKLLDRTEMSHNLRGSLQRAITYAFEQSHRQVTLEHLLLAFADDREAAVILESSSVDVPDLMTDVSGYLGRLDDRVQGGQPQQPELGQDVQHIIQSAGAAAQKSKRRAVTSALVLAAVVGDGRSPSAQMLRNHGLTFENAIAALKQANSNASPSPPSGPAAAQPAPARSPAQPLPSPPSPVTPSPAPAASTPAPGSALAASTAAATNAGAARLQNMQAAHEIIASARERIAAARGTIATRPDETDLSAPPAAAEQPPQSPVPSSPPSQQTSSPTPPAPAPSSLTPEPPVYRDAPGAETAATPAAAEPEMTRSPPAIDMRPPPIDPAKLEPQAPPPTAPPKMPPSTPPEWAAKFRSVAGEVAAGGTDAAQTTPPARPQPPLPAPPKLAPPPTFESAPKPPRLAPPAARSPAPSAAAPTRAAPPASVSLPDPGPDRLLTRPPAPGPRLSAAPPPDALSSLPYESPPPPAPEPPAAPPGQPSTLPNMQGQPAPPPPHEHQPKQHPTYNQQSAQRPYETPGGLPANVPQYAQPAPPPPTAYVPTPPSPPAMHPGQPAPDISPIDPEVLTQEIPKRMRVGIPQTIEIRAPRARLEAWSGGNADPRARDEQIITKAMVMRLRAPEGGFTIETASPETQWSEGYMGPLSDDVVSWRWIVTPVERGYLPMQLSVSSRIVGRDGLAAARALPEQLVAIRVAPNYGRMASRVAIGAGLVIAGLVLGYFGDGLFGIGSSLLAQR